MKRQPGISVLIATQNEEATVDACIRSFFDFGDEIIVVDNGSTDDTKDIVRDFERRHPDKIRFFDAPDLPDLHHNRQYALERSRFQWIVRGDADFIAYTSGDWDIAHLRAFLRSGKRRFPPAIAVPIVNVSVDYWHTGPPRKPGGMQANLDRWYLTPAYTSSRVRLYRHFPGFRFQRRGRWEATRYHLAYRGLARIWPNPVWMHCTIKPDIHHFVRSERTNWREQGDFQRFPTLRDYIASIIGEKYGTTDMDAAARIYMERHIFPYLIPYDESQHGAYPAIVRELMRDNPVYRISERNGLRVRDRVEQKTTAAT
ncbi:MAG: glycosyltransferase [Phycisphaerales bacterium]|nr:glycosyltransferase [Phycisphaerales bacterium]MCB9864243.1 glycosyltransferase [Phycisphaerales bacterium]